MTKLLFLALATTLHASDLAPWVLDPPVGAVGYGSSERIALLQAKAELARQKKLHIKSQSAQENHTFSSQSTQTSAQTLRDITIKERFNAPDGMVYVWVIEE